MMNIKKGEIATILTIASFIVISVVGLISSNLSKKSQTTKAKAEANVVCRQGYPNDGGCDRCGNDGRFSDVSINWWDTGCLDFCRAHQEDAACLWCNFEGKEIRIRSSAQYDFPTGNSCNTSGTPLSPTPPPANDFCQRMDPNTRQIIPGSQGQSCNNLSKCDIAGGCNGSCCRVSEDCPSGMVCTNSNGYCQSGLACEVGQSSVPPPNVSPVPPSDENKPCGGQNYRCIFGLRSGQSGPVICENNNQDLNVSGCRPVPNESCIFFASIDECVGAQYAGKDCQWYGSSCRKCGSKGVNPCSGNEDTTFQPELAGVCQKDGGINIYKCEDGKYRSSDCLSDRTGFDSFEAACKVVTHNNNECIPNCKQVTKCTYELGEGGSKAMDILTDCKSGFEDCNNRANSNNYLLARCEVQSSDNSQTEQNVNCRQFDGDINKCTISINNGNDCRWIPGCGKCASDGEKIDDVCPQYGCADWGKLSEGFCNATVSCIWQNGQCTKKTEEPKEVRKIITVMFWDKENTPILRDVDKNNVALCYSNNNLIPDFDPDCMQLDFRKSSSPLDAIGHNYDISYKTGVRPGKKEWFCMWNKVKNNYFCNKPLN